MLLPRSARSPSVVVALVVLNDTLVEETYTAERIVYQRYPDGSAQLKLWADGRVVQYVSYRRCEKLHRIDGELSPPEPLPAAS